MIILKVAGQQFKVAECGFFLRVQFKRILKIRFIFTPTAISKDLNKIYKILINLELQNLPISLKKCMNSLCVYMSESVSKKQ